jgi:hypothetical protein
MAITTDCPKCARRYKAPDQMVGHRVRCRGCGTVFPLTTGGDGGDADLSALAELAGTGDPAAALAAAAGPRDEESAVFDSAFADFKPTVRPNRPFYFPLAHLLDRHLPAALFIGSGLWVTIEAFNRNQPANALWVPVVRLLLLVAGYFGVVRPLGYFAVTKAARLAKFELPPSAKLRSAATLALPYGIVCLLWLTVGNFADAVPGVILGLAVVMGCVWLLIRIQPEEAAVTLGLSSAAFLASLLILVGLLSGVNAVAQMAAGESKASLAESPIGPGLAWDVPTSPGKGGGTPSKKGLTVADGAAAPSDTGTPPADGASTSPGTPIGTPADPTVNPATLTPPVAGGPPEGGTPPAVAVVPPTAVPPAAVAGGTKPAANDPLAGSRLFGQGASAERPTDTPPPVVPDVPPDPDPIIRPPAVAVASASPPRVPGVGPDPVLPLPDLGGGDDPVANEIRATRSPLVASARAAGAIGSFERLVPTLIPSPVALVLKRAGGSGDADQVDVWNLDKTARIGSIDVKRDAGKGVGLVDGAPTYAVSPDGAAWARVTSFPSLGLESTPLAGNAAPTRITFKDLFGDASVLGYVAADRVLVRWRNGENVRLEIWDLKAKVMIARVLAAYHPTSPGNGVVSPDGKLYAAVVGVPNRTGGFRAQLAIYDLARPPGRTAPVIGMDSEQAVKPTGMAFSSDMRTFGLLYEQSGNTVLLSYRLANLSAMTPVPVAAGKVPVPATPEKAFDRLSSIADGRGWLVGGNAVLDADTGGLLGTLGVTQPCSHATVGSGVELIHGEGGSRSLAVVTFNKIAIGKPAAPVAPSAPVGPATPAAPTPNKVAPGRGTAPTAPVSPGTSASAAAKRPGLPVPGTAAPTGAAVPGR